MSLLSMVLIWGTGLALVFLMVLLWPGDEVPSLTTLIPTPTLDIDPPLVVGADTQVSGASDPVVDTQTESSDATETG